MFTFMMFLGKVLVWTFLTVVTYFLPLLLALLFLSGGLFLLRVLTFRAGVNFFK